MESIPKTTIKVPKSTLEEIKGYCIKNGKQVGDWVETAWEFISKNDFDIYDKEATPCLSVPEKTEKEHSQVEILCKLMAEFITAQKQVVLPSPELIAHASEEKAKAEAKIQEQEKEIQRMREENIRLCNKIEYLEKCKETAGKELIRCKGLFSSANSETIKSLGLG